MHYLRREEVREDIIQFMPPHYTLKEKNLVADEVLREYDRINSNDRDRREFEIKLKEAMTVILTASAELKKYGALDMHLMRR